MKRHREFQIAWLGLKEGISEFEFDLNDQILNDLGYELEDIKGLNVTVHLKFDKHSSFFILDFDVNGVVQVPCDRCGDDFELKLWDEFNLIVKLTDSEEEAERQNESEDPDVVFVSRTESVINVFEWIYDFVMLSIPFQHVHPDNENGETTCNPEALKLLEQLRAPENKTNPIWDQLKNINK